MKYILSAMLTLITVCGYAQLRATDDFEKPSLSTIWDTSRIERNAFTMQSQVKHLGKSAIKITLHQGDKYEAGNDSSLVSERDELLEARNLFSKEDSTYEYRFSMFIPANFPIVPTRLVIAQWKQGCIQAQCSDDSPVLALRYSGGKLQITIQTGPHREVYYETSDDLRNKWTTFRLQARFSRTPKGSVKAWINEKSVLTFDGKTCYSAERGYSAKSLIYFKMGLYRDKMPEPMVIYIDDYTKRQL
jgi:hypothetical protein